MLTVAATTNTSARIGRARDDRNSTITLSPLGRTAKKLPDAVLRLTVEERVHRVLADGPGFVGLDEMRGAGHHNQGAAGG